MKRRFSQCALEYVCCRGAIVPAYYHNNGKIVSVYSCPVCHKMAEEFFPLIYVGSIGLGRVAEGNQVVKPKQRKQYFKNLEEANAAETVFADCSQGGAPPSGGAPVLR